MFKKNLTNWNRYPVINSEIISPDSEAECIRVLKRYPQLIPRGLGRSYGDASLAAIVLDCTSMNKIVELNISKMQITVEAGISIDAILMEIVPAGLFLPVVPGTKFITVGGAIAADIHGKNHHKDGTFSRHVEWIDIIDDSLKVLRCSVTENSELFKKTCGGMGISGVILKACLNLRKIETTYVKCTNIPFFSLHELLVAFETYKSTTYNVAWLDTLSFKGGKLHAVLMLGEHAVKKELPKAYSRDAFVVHSSPKINVPDFFPTLLLNRFTINFFNHLLFFTKKISAHKQVLHYDNYFFPLDKIKNWNRFYGKKGFIQYQCVVPASTKGEEALNKILETCSMNGKSSFLSVLKAFGEENPLSYMSFPEPGYTLSMDLKMNPDLFEFLTKLDTIVENCGGKLYLAKDARMDRLFFEKSYRNPVKSNRFVSLLSKRLGLDTIN